MKPITPQARTVLEYLQSGRELTPLIAAHTMGVSSVTTRISELRKAGWKIIATWSRDHFGKRYKKYSMEKTDAAAQSTPNT